MYPSQVKERDSLLKLRIDKILWSVIALAFVLSSTIIYPIGDYRPSILTGALAWMKSHAWAQPITKKESIFSIEFSANPIPQWIFPAFCQKSTRQKSI